MQVLQNVLSIRLFLVCLFTGAIVGGVMSLLWSPLVYVGLVGGGILWLLAVFNPATVLYCPHCRKRVKLGAESCHHCGRTVV
jgi:hypothetical protein